jgi:hypothetical protein
MHHDTDLVLQVAHGLLHGSVRLMIMCWCVRRRDADVAGAAHLVDHVLHEGSLGPFTIGLEDASSNSEPPQLCNGPADRIRVRASLSANDPRQDGFALARLHDQERPRVRVVAVGHEAVVNRHLDEAFIFVTLLTASMRMISCAPSHTIRAPRAKREVREFVLSSLALGGLSWVAKGSNS